MKRLPRSLRLLATVGQIRTATYQNREHIVVPTIALMEGVIWPINADSPEFVPAEELAVAPGGWNGRPCMPDHPIDGEQRVSANEPTILEQYAFGQVFNARYADKQLHLEGWLDPIRAAAVGRDAENVIARVRAGEMVEVSVGVFVTAEETSGEYNGRQYKMIWRNIVPDHLAFLPEGVTGACSNDMGCGAPRTATVHRMARGGYELVRPSRQVVPVLFDLKAIRERIAGAWTSRAAAEGISDADLRRMLNEALQPIEPGFMGVESVFPQDKTFVYACYLEGEGGGFHTYERSYTMDGTNVTVSKERTEVAAVTSYEPVNAAAGTSRAACGCGGNSQPTVTGGNETMLKKERVQKLLKKLRIKETPTVLAAYEAMPDDTLAQLEQQELEEVPAATTTPAAAPATTPAAAPAATTPAPAVAAAAPTPAPVAAAAATTTPRTEEQVLAEMPESMRRVFTQHRAAETVRKAYLVGKLKTAQSEYTEVQLQAMSVDELERIGRLLQVETPSIPGMDFGPAAPLATAAQNQSGVPAPINLNDRIRAASGKTQTQ